MVTQILSYLKKIDIAYVFFLAALILAVFFLYKYSQLNEQLLEDAEKLSKTVQKLKTLELGDAVPPLTSLNLSGQNSNLNFCDGKKHLVFVYTTHCKFCQEDFPKWNILINDLQTQNYNIHAISLDSIEETNANLDSNLKHLKDISIIAPNENFLRTFRVAETPTIFIASQTVVEWVHTGQLNDEKIQELKATISK